MFDIGPNLCNKQFDNDLEDVLKSAKKEGVEPLRIAGARKVVAGITSLEEVLRVVPLS